MLLRSLLVAFFLFLTSTNQSHFRGGSIMWQPVNPNIKFPVNYVEVLITTRFYWDLNRFAPLCNSIVGITNGNLIGDA